MTIGVAFRWRGPSGDPSCGGFGQMTMALAAIVGAPGIRGVPGANCVPSAPSAGSSGTTTVLATIVDSGVI